MRRATIIATTALALVAPGATAAPTHHDLNHINTCLRAHGWPYGLRALQRIEIRVNHPNGLIHTCGGRDAI